MILVGIDVASDKHDVSIMRDSGEIIRENFTVLNKEVGYKKLLGEIEKAKKLYKDDNIRIGLESTGVYSVGLTEFLENKFPGSVVLINPVLTSMFELSIHVHYAKTDKNDALGICKFLSKNNDIRTYAPVSYHTKQLRELYRERIKMNKRLNQDANRLKGQLHIVFPEFLEKHHTLGKFELELLSRHPSAASLKEMKAKNLVKELSKVGYLRINLDKASKIIELAKSSVGNENYEDFVISQTAKRIIFLKKQIKEMNEKITEIVKKDYSYLLSIDGVGAISIGGIVGEIGDVNNYHGSDSIVALAGLCPYVYESGKYEANHTRITKNGSSYLRNALFMAVQSMYLHKVNPIYDYVEKKRKEGKSKVCALDHAARKFCNIIFAMMKTKSKFASKSVSN